MVKSDTNSFRVIFIHGKEYGYFKRIYKAYFCADLELKTTKDVKEAKKFSAGDDCYIKQIMDIMEANSLKAEIIKIKGAEYDEKI